MGLCAPSTPLPAHGAAPDAADTGGESRSGERRGGRRRGFDYRLLLTPLDAEDTDAEPVYVTGRDLGPRGVGIRHAEPITHRKVRLSAADPTLGDLGLGDLQIDLVLRWCRFIAPGVYESGGRITRTSAPVF